MKANIQNTDFHGLLANSAKITGKSAVVFHAGTKRNEQGEFVNAGGRVLGVTALGSTLEEAITNAYTAAKPISWQDMHFRTDIGKV